MSKNIIIIGAGLSGMYLAYLLKKEEFSIKILEANNRIGGRIYTKSFNNTKVELGATWLWRYNPELLKVCKALGISIFEQNMTGDALYDANIHYTPERFQIPKNQEISYRIVGGTATLIEKLKAHLNQDVILLNQKVRAVKSEQNSVKVSTQSFEFITDLVISTIPPSLLINSVDFYPKLETELIQITKNTHTWMKDAIKFAVVYKNPFWLEKNLSGTGFSYLGPFTEIYDHSDFDRQHFALMGFINDSILNQSKNERELQVKHQLIKFFGDVGGDYLAYEEKVWSNETLLNFIDNANLSPHKNNGHLIYQQEFLNGKLIITGSETSPHFGGYMEGAIFRGNQVLNQLKKKFYS